MQVPFAEGRHILPGLRAEAADPVGGRLPVLPVAEDIIIHIFRISGEGFFEPLVLGGGMVKHHVEHEAHPQLPGLADHGFTVLHRSEHGIF